MTICDRLLLCGSWLCTSSNNATPLVYLVRLSTISTTFVTKTARQLRAAAAAHGGTVRRVAEHTGMDDTSDPSDDESEAEGTSEVGSDTDEDDEREAASGGAHGGTA